MLSSEYVGYYIMLEPASAIKAKTSIEKHENKYNHAHFDKKICNIEVYLNVFYCRWHDYHLH